MLKTTLKNHAWTFLTFSCDEYLLGILIMAKNDPELGWACISLASCYCVGLMNLLWAQSPMMLLEVGAIKQI